MKSFAISFAFIFISCLGFAQSRQYLLAGQSNARGRGDATLAPTVAPMTSYEYHPTLNILFQLQDPVGVNSGAFQQAATGSAWPAFAKTYYDMTSDTTVMIPAARGGSGVHPISASSGANWSSNGILYSLCKFKTDQAMMLTGLPLDGIVWVQGEQDAARITFGAYEQDDYRDALIALIDRFREDYGCAVPFYMVLLGANTEDPVEGYDAVRAAQVEVAAIHPHTYLIHENAVNFPALGWMLDNVHYTQDGYNEIGEEGAANVVNIERTYYSTTASTIDGQLLSTTDTICRGDSVMLSAPPMYTDYQWSNGDTGQNIFVTEGNKYTVMVTDTAGCTFALRSTQVNAYPDQVRPTIFLSEDDTLCVGDMLTLTASPAGQDFIWSNGETTSTITVSTADDFFVQTMDTNGCLSLTSDTVSTTVVSLSVPTITSSNPLSSTICEGDSVILSAPTGFDTYLWSNGESTPSITVFDSGTYSCAVGQADCFSEPSEPNIITVIPTPPAPTIAANSATTFCEGDSVTLTASTEFDRYDWSTGDTTQSITVYDSGIYSCIFISENGCIGEPALVFVTENPLPATPSITAVGSTELCEGDDLTLNAPAGFDAYEWSTGESTQSIIVNAAGTYDVTVSDTNGCQSPPSAPITTTINPLPTAPIISTNGSTTFCDGDSVTLSVPTGFTNYQWSNGESTPSITVYDSDAYFCIITDANGCVSPVSNPINTTAIAAPAAPIITTSGSTTFCEGQSVTLTAPSGFTDYTWSNGDTTQSITVYNSGTFDVFVSNNNDCQSPVSAPVTVTSISSTIAPLIVIDGETMLCEGESVILTAPSGLSGYLWSNGATTQSIFVSTTGTYICTITSADGCESPPSDPIEITVNPLPNTPTITPNNSTTFCEGDNVILAAPIGFDTYLWSNGETTQSITVTDSGTYDLIITDANGCTSAPSASIVTTLNTISTPSITAQSSTTFCEGESVILAAPMGFDNYLWSNGETTQSITVTDSGTFDVIITDANGCESMPSAPITTTVISASTPPIITANGAINICQGENVMLSAPTGFSDYLWSNGETTQDITVDASGTYTCIITSTNGCESPPSDPIEITVNPLPNTPTITPNNSTTFCEGDNVILAAPIGFDTYLWSNGETTQSITVTDSGTYDVIITDANGCTSAPSASIVTTLNVTSTPSITAQSSTTFCEGQSVILTAPAGFTYLWSNGETTQNIIVIDSGVYDVTTTDANGCTSPPSAPITTTAISSSVAPIISTSGTTTLCQGENVVLTAPAGSSDYLWSNGAMAQSITVSTTGMYSCIITSVNGCESPPSEPIEVMVNPLPAMPIITSNPSNTFCEGDNVTLMATAGFDNYLWSNGETTQSITVSTSGTFDVMVIDANGCESPLSEAITTNINAIPTPSITAQSSTTFCEGESVTLTAPAGFTYLWSNGEITESITVTDSDTYTVIVADANGCESMPSAPISTTAISASTPPIITANSATNICQGEDVMLSAPAGFSDYLWSNGADTQDITVNASGTYTCIITSANGCQSPPSDPIEVIVNALPNAPSITPNSSTTFCEGDNVILAAPMGFSDYLWSNGETTQSVTITDSGTYDVIVTDLNGCMSAPSASISVNVNSVATPSITPSGATTFCEGESVTLTAPAGFTYLWSNGEITQSITVTDSDTYHVVVTDNNGCESPNSMPVTVVALSSTTPPILTASGTTSLCEGESVTLTAPTGFTNYLWSNGAITQDITVNVSGTFTCEITSANGCPSPPSEPITVTVSPLPGTPSIIANSATTFCEGESVTLTAPAGFTYLWSNGETTQNIIVTDSGTYDCIVINANGCTSPTSAAITTNVTPIAAPTVTAGGATTFCEGESVTLSAPSNFTDYLWSNGEITQNITVTDSGIYDVTVTDTNGCISPASTPINVVALSVDAAPQLTASGATTLCDGETVTLSAPSGLSGYLWSTGAITQDITVSASGTFTCEITNTNGCESPPSAPITVTVNLLPMTPTITNNAPTTFCEGESVTLSAPSGFTNYLWSNGEITQSITVTDSGVFDVMVMDGNGCESPASTPVNVVSLSSSTAPEILLSGATTICEGESVTLSAPSGLTGYLWSTGETTPSITVNTSGTFNCEIIDNSGCVSPPSEPVTITVNPLPTAPIVTASSATIFCEGETVTLSAPSGFDNYEWSTGETTQNITVSDSGDYDVFVTNANGCISPNSPITNITVNALPNATAIVPSGATTFCDGDSVILSAPSGFSDYEWSTGETTQSITVFDAGTYDYFVTDVNGCISADSPTLTVSTNVLPTAPEIVASGATTFCEGESVTLSAPAGFSNYEWSTGETTQSITVTNSGTFDCFIGDSNGCASAISAPVNVTVNPLPTAPTVTASSATTFCEGETVTLSAPSGFDNYEWSNGETTQSITVSDSGDYDVFVTNANGCISPNSPLTNITVNALPNATEIVANGATTFCDGDSVILSAPSGFSDYEWSTGETTQSITVFDTGTYDYFVTDINTCISSNSTPLEVVVNDLPTAPEIIASSATTFCEGESVTLSAPSGFSDYEWSTGETTQSITVYESGIYDYFLTNGNSCVSSNSNPIEITVNPTPTTPTISTSGLTTFCEGESVILSAPSGFDNYEWSNGATTETITVTNSGDYDVFVTNNNGCVSLHSQAINVTVNGLPSATAITASGATTFCEGESVTLFAPAGFDNYEWSNGATTQSIIVYDSGTYGYFLADANGCISADSEPLAVVVNELPPIPQLVANGATEFCEGESVMISAPAGFNNYLWSNGETTQEINVSAEGSYDVTITNANGCSSASDISAKIIVNPPPAEPIVQAVGAPVFCEGDSVTLVVPGGFSTYLWSTGETTQDITVSETGAFYCTVTDVNGCENVSTAFSTIENESLPVPQVTFSGETEFCEGGSVTLFAPSGYFYLWSNGETTQDITLTETSGPLSCIIMDANGCMSEWSEDTFVKVFSVPPVPTIDTIGFTTLCLGNTVGLSAPAGFDSYLWSNGETTQNISVGVSGNYSVTVYNEDGCTNQSATAVNVSVNPTPQQPTIAVGGSTNFCDGESVTLSAPPDAPGYLWSNGETTQSITVSETGAFSCVILDEFDCQSSSSVTVSTLVFDLPDSPAISLSDDAILCPGDTVILSVEPGFAAYLWSDGSVSEEIIATSDGEYSYIVLDDNGCQSSPSETIVIEVRPLPPPANIHSSNDFNFCEGDSITLEADAGYLSYLWSTGETDSIISVNRADEFFYVADDGFSCEDVVSVSVATGINPPPPTATIQQIGIDTLCASQAADRYMWYRNDTLTDFTTRCIAPEMDGNWQVVSIVDACLSDFSTAYEYTGRPPIDPNAPPGMSVFPNPSNDGFITIRTINIPETAAVLDIYDVLGRLLYRRQLDIQGVSGYELTIDIERLPAAVYVAVIDAGFSGRYAQKFVVND